MITLLSDTEEHLDIVAGSSKHILSLLWKIFRFYEEHMGQEETQHKVAEEKEVVQTHQEIKQREEPKSPLTSSSSGNSIGLKQGNQTPSAKSPKSGRKIQVKELKEKELIAREREKLRGQYPYIEARRQSTDEEKPFYSESDPDDKPPVKLFPSEVKSPKDMTPEQIREYKLQMLNKYKQEHPDEIPSDEESVITSSIQKIHGPYSYSDFSSTKNEVEPQKKKRGWGTLRMKKFKKEKGLDESPKKVKPGLSSIFSPRLSPEDIPIGRVDDFERKEESIGKCSVAHSNNYFLRQVRRRLRFNSRFALFVPSVTT